MKVGADAVKLKGYEALGITETGTINQPKPETAHPSAKPIERATEVGAKTKEPEKKESKAPEDNGPSY